MPSIKTMKYCLAVFTSNSICSCNCWRCLAVPERSHAFSNLCFLTVTLILRDLKLVGGFLFERSFIVGSKLISCLAAVNF